jgi:hypothetical protein
MAATLAGCYPLSVAFPDGENQYSDGIGRNSTNGGAITSLVPVVIARSAICVGIRVGIPSTVSQEAKVALALALRC